jgi:enterochelin esterase-like enzyme
MAALPKLKLGPTHLAYDDKFTFEDQPALSALVEKHRLHDAAVVGLDYIGTTVRAKYMTDGGRTVGFLDFRILSRSPQGKARWQVYRNETWVAA